MQAKVPKFIDIEDKVVGPLTWRQFTYLAFGISFAFLAFSQFKSYIGAPLAFGITALAIALAFVHVNGRPFTTFLFSLWQYNTNPHRYFWKQEHEMPKIEPLPIGRNKKELKGKEKRVGSERIFRRETLQHVAGALDALEPPTRKAERERKKLQEDIPGIVVQNFVQEREGSKATLLFPDLGGK